jgi:magnesium transporter
MTGNAENAIAALNSVYLRDFPLGAAKDVEAMPPSEVAKALAGHPVPTLASLMESLAPDIAASLLGFLEDEVATSVLSSTSPNAALTILNQLDEAERQRRIAELDPALQREFSELMSFPDDSAGRLMETRIGVFRPEFTVAQALERLRRSKLRGLQSIYLVDDEQRLSGRVAVHDLAIAEADQRLLDIREPVDLMVQAVAPRDEVVELLERSRLPSMPVTDFEGRLLGVVRYASLIRAMQEVASDDLQTMVGASKDERALSKAMFAVRKRQPWLQVNLLTAFLAAAVVGLFENTIAQVTALAVLLPVVAGQSGNAGAQALAVTMRGLALREITLRDWSRVTIKEVQVGFVNGIAIALTCGVGVFLWSGSPGLVAVIAMSMVLAMVAAGFAGAVVPIALKRLGQDPAQSSSIVLTTVTDIAGFFSFLGIATILMSML